jgi:hypothetical protein
VNRVGGGGAELGLAHRQHRVRREQGGQHEDDQQRDDQRDAVFAAPVMSGAGVRDLLFDYGGPPTAKPLCRM